MARIVLLTLTFYAPWVHSLKEKRMEVQSLLAKLRNKFNVSAIESSHQDVHQTIGLSVAALTANNAQADSFAENILHFIESATDAELTSIEKELL